MHIYENQTVNTFMSRKVTLFHSVLDQHTDIFRIILLYLKFCNVFLKTHKRLQFQDNALSSVRLKKASIFSFTIHYHLLETAVTYWQ